MDIFQKKLEEIQTCQKEFKQNLDKFRTPHNLDKFREKLDKFRTPRFTDADNERSTNRDLVIQAQSN